MWRISKLPLYKCVRGLRQTNMAIVLLSQQVSKWPVTASLETRTIAMHIVSVLRMNKRIKSYIALTLVTFQRTKIIWQICLGQDHIFHMKSHLPAEATQSTWFWDGIPNHTLILGSQSKILKIDPHLVSFYDIMWHNVTYFDGKNNSGDTIASASDSKIVLDDPGKGNLSLLFTLNSAYF